MLEGLWQNLDYAASVVLFCIGLYTVITKSNLIKKFMGLNIMETSVFAFIVALGVVEAMSRQVVYEALCSDLEYLT
jgi:multicomponent Na+:H+ antiporter subunit C